MNLQDIIMALERFWVKEGCLLWQPYDVEKGAGTFNPGTFLMALGKKPWAAARNYSTNEPSRSRE